MGKEGEQQADTTAGVEPFECYAWIGEDEAGSGVVGLKGGHVPAGFIPLVSTERHKLETDDLVTQHQGIVNRYGMARRLVRLVAVEEVRRVEMAPPAITIEGVHVVRGRGTVITGTATGPFSAGDVIACGEMTTEVAGVERFAVPNPPISPVGLLVRVGPEACTAGQVWRKVT